MFKDSTCKRLFFILLVDLLSQTDKEAPIEKTSFLGGLTNIGKKPAFSVNNSESELVLSVDALKRWVNTKIEVDIWMPSINKQPKLSISRFDVIKMCGNLSKHNHLRAMGIAIQFQKIMQLSNIEINIEEALKAFPDFYEKFHNDILIYLSGHICELLNNIRLAIHFYLQPEFKRSHYYTDAEQFLYAYKIPDLIKSEYAKVCYWELMNSMRRGPLMKKFSASTSFKSLY